MIEFVSVFQGDKRVDLVLKAPIIRLSIIPTDGTFCIQTLEEYELWRALLV
jgi:hypothetical protein